MKFNILPRTISQLGESLPPLSTPLKLPAEGEVVAEELQAGAASLGSDEAGEGRQEKEKYFENKHPDCLQSSQ